MKFKDFYELVAKVIEYEDLLKEGSYRRKKSMGTYCQEVNQEVAVADLFAIGTFTCPLLVEKAPEDHQIPNKDELRGKVYCKYHNSWNHTTNAYWGFRNFIQDMINKGILKFPNKKRLSKSMRILSH